MVSLLVTLALPVRAFAALGSDVASVTRDREALHGALTVTRGAAYEIHELQLPAGVVREYVAPGGPVFAVTWRGPRAPDLRQLLGTYFDRYAAEARTHRTGHHVLSIETPDFVAGVVRFQRGFQGRAIVPALTPAGISRAELR